MLNRSYAPFYRLLPLVVFASFVLGCLLDPQNLVFTGNLTDSDDYMRLNEVMNWLSGQGWYDLSHPRLSPGAHTVVHWSRLVDLPLALFMLPFIKVLGMQGAALLASFIVPPLYFVLLLFLVLKAAEPFVGQAYAPLAVLFIPFSPMVQFNFLPGRVDHHNIQILVAGMGLFCLQKLVRDKTAWRFAVCAAFVFACGLWVGTEAFLWLVVFTGCLALLAAWQGVVLLRHAAVFGVSLALFTAALLPLALPVEDFSSRALSWFSPADLIFAVLTAAVFVLGWLGGRLIENRWKRLSLMGFLGFLAILLFVYFVPDTLKGPFADYDVFNATTALDTIGEAMPLTKRFQIKWTNHLTLISATSTFFQFVLLPLMGLIATGIAIKLSAGSKRTIWILQGLFLGTGFLLTLFWQVRVAFFMQLFNLVPLTWILVKGWEGLEARFGGWRGAAAKLVFFLMLAPLPAILVPSLLTRLVASNEVQGESYCSLEKMAGFLNRTYENRNLTILADMNDGPELLFRTPFNVLGGNFNVAGNPDVFAFFNARDDEKPLEILRKWKIDLVLVCKNFPPFYAGLDHKTLGVNAFLRPGKDGRLHLVSSPTHMTLIENLVNDKLPAWLRPVEIPDNRGYLLFEVKEGEGENRGE